ncbi:hypothetical protein CTAYLR_000649 [Chrysophaeum taylorii]|uniref:Uncharacterized protein n=1 Tax=Chrysophaeum taylorii TaxID=2483200 RepID=A0AAD7XLE2_9STRA|nr:hypothetical protein CTAYLR_000649 [Chrysophaeum taylorii]
MVAEVEGETKEATIPSPPPLPPPKEEVPRVSSGVEWGQVEIISNLRGGVQQSQQLPYVRLMVLWNVAFAAVGGSAVAWLELGHTDTSWLNCIYLGLNATTATGLSSFDLTELRPASKFVVAALMQAGAATLVSLFPLCVRITALEAALPGIVAETPPNSRRWWLGRWLEGRRKTRKLVTFDLRKYRMVPEWLVEYKALCFLLRIVLVYHAIVYLVYGGLLFCVAKWKANDDTQGFPLAWSAFTVVSAFNNVGLTLQKDAFESLVKYPTILFAAAMCALHGNVLYPACLRWIIVWLSARSPRSSNRKVYFRYLLLHGRKLYSSLFSSQATWLLVATQLALISIQIGVTLIASRDDSGFRDRSGPGRLNVAAFEAVNTRHAGITAVDVRTLHGATLTMQMAMMWLAPVPFVVALQSSVYGREPEPRRYRAGRRISLGTTSSEETVTAPEDPATPVPDAMVDTRALLIERYPDRSPPWTARVSARLDAFFYHIRHSAKSAYYTSGFARDASLIFFAWFLIACFENYRAPNDVCAGDSARLFYAAFELASAFGNVGLSLGSISSPSANASYSHDLSTGSLLVMMCVMVGARTRDMPRRIDAALTLPTLTGPDVLRATIITRHGTPVSLNEAAAADDDDDDENSSVASHNSPDPPQSNTSTMV